MQYLSSRRSLLLLFLASVPVAAGLTSSARAQVAVPTVASAAEGNGVGWIAGFGTRSRQQFVIHKRVLRGVVGRTLSSLEFRRDDWLGGAFAASTSRLTVYLQPSVTPPSLVSEYFDRNRSSGQPVFQGVVSLPASPALSGPTTWGAQHRVAIPLSRPFYCAANTHLLIDISGEPTSAHGGGWPVDFVSQTPAGAVRSLGHGCGVVGARFPRPLRVMPTELIAGANARVHVFGRDRTSGFLLIGQLLATPLQLAGVGMPGCRLDVDVGVALPLSYGRSAASATEVSKARYWLKLPRQRSILGAQFAMQAGNLELGTQRSNALGVTTTNSLSLTVAPGMVDPDWTTIESEPVFSGEPLPGVGTIRFARIPVIRFR